MARDLSGALHRHPSPGQDSLLAGLQNLIRAHVLLAKRGGRRPFASIPKAAKRFWEMYRSAAAGSTETLQIVADAEGVFRPVLELRAAA